MSIYFTFSGLTKFSLARAEAVNAIFQAISAGFDKLPDPDALNQGRQNYVTAAGTANDLTVSLPKAPPSYVEGLRMSVKVTQTCTTPATINVNGLGVKAIVRADGSATAAQDLVAGQIIDMQYDGTQFRLIAASEVLAAASAAAASASATNAASSASNAATSATNAHTSEVNAAASAAAAAAASKVNKAGDTMTGQLVMNTGLDEQIKLQNLSPYISWWNAAGSVRFGFLQMAAGGITLSSDAGALTLRSNGTTRLIFDTAGNADFQNVAVKFSGGIVRASNTGSDEKVRLIGTNPFLSAYDGSDTTRRGYLQWSGTTGVVLASDAGFVQLTAGGVAGFTLDGNKDVTGPRNLTISGTMTIAGNTAWHAGNLTSSALNTIYGFTPLSSISGSMVTTALGYTPYNATNPSGFITSAALSPYALIASPTFTGTPAAPTATAGTATTQIATTAFSDGLRDLPGRATAGSTTLAATDRGGHVVYTGTGGHTFTVPPSVFANGNIVTIINDGTGNLNIARGSGVVMRWASTGADADRVLAPGGMCAVVRPANGTNRFIVSGAGLT